jgi:hypothetical protein
MEAPLEMRRWSEIVQTMPVVLHEYLNLIAPPDETRVGSGRLFATGLNLPFGSPEGSDLLGQFVGYTRSHDFAPRTSMSLSALRGAIKQISAANRLTGSSKARIV